MCASHMTKEQTFLPAPLPDVGGERERYGLALDEPLCGNRLCLGF